MKDLLDYIDGRKTYIATAITIAYVFGAKLGWWPLDEFILTLLGGSAVAALRAGVTKNGPTDNKPTP